MPDKERSQEEILLRENIRKAIRVVLGRRSKESERERLEEQTLRKIIRGMIAESKSTAPQTTTGMNAVQKVINDIEANLGDPDSGYKSLTTSKAQRDSFRIMMIAFVEDALDIEQMNKDAPNPVSDLTDKVNEIDVQINDEDDEGIVPIVDPEETDQSRVDRESLQLANKIGLDTEALDDTGRKRAFKVFNNSIKSPIERGMDDLTDPEDLEIYKEYLVKNINARFDAFEQQLANTIDDVDIDMKTQAQAEPQQEEPVAAEEEAEEIVGLEEFVDLDELLSNL
jgi:hypothetical protein